MSREGRLLETASDPEITEKWDKDFGECSAQINNKHRHDTQTRQEPPERCKTKTKTEQIINKQRPISEYDRITVKYVTLPRNWARMVVGLGTTGAHCCTALFIAHTVNLAQPARIIRVFFYRLQSQPKVLSHVCTKLIIANYLTPC